MERDLAEALACITPGVDPDPGLVHWAADELLSGREMAAVLSELTAQGWPADIAEASLEAARVRTRRERGVVTRDDVAGPLEARHRRSTSGMAAFYRSGGGPLGIIAFATGLRQALAAMRQLSRIARKNRPDRD